jgi:signal peptidase II
VPSEPFNTRRAWLAWLLAAAGLAVLDQALKAAIVATIPLYGTAPLAPGFNLVHTLNPGAAFSFLANASGWQRPLLLAVAAGVSIVLAVALRRGVTRRLEALGYVGVIGGAVGNAADRLRIGAVVDYLDFYWRDMHWPAFNAADIFVVCGAALVIVAHAVHPESQLLGRRAPPA